MVAPEDVHGCIHAHSTYSDGINTLEEMARACLAQGWEYLVISDHSKAAFYANGLNEASVEAQWAEIDRLNEVLAPFRIFKGIEADILSDGSLDYSDDFRAQFEFVIASVHSPLEMDTARATARLVRAIEHPQCTLLGHPTGRLLLRRPGYAPEMEKVIDACAANGVAIEINANPLRLDLDWRWTHYAQEQGVWIAVNPDAHAVDHLSLMRYGLLSAQKGGLQKDAFMNRLGRDALRAHLRQRNQCS
jgi:DNA polymerase (family 10)